MQADMYLNLDSETWGNFTIGSAGGIDITATLQYKEVENDQEAAVRVTLKGLRGGHPDSKSMRGAPTPTRRW